MSPMVTSPLRIVQHRKFGEEPVVKDSAFARFSRQVKQVTKPIVKSPDDFPTSSPSARSLLGTTKEASIGTKPAHIRTERERGRALMPEATMPEASDHFWALQLYGPINPCAFKNIISDGSFILYILVKQRGKYSVEQVSFLLWF